MNNDLNQDLLLTIKESYKKYLETSPQSNEKLKVLHGFVAKCLEKELDKYEDENIKYSIKSLGYKEGREGEIEGRYYNKKVDIIIYKNSLPIAGIAVKFVTSNYSQNSNNYFENMLGETANIRSNKIPYFQIFLITDKIPYFLNDGKLKKYEEISSHNLRKYLKLSEDNTDIFFHTPNKTFVGIFNIDNLPVCSKISNRKDYIDYFSKNEFHFSFSKINLEFGLSFIYNSYSSFIEKVVHYSLSI